MKKLVILSLTFAFALCSFAQGNRPQRKGGFGRRPPMQRQQDSALVKLSETFVADSLTTDDFELFYCSKEYKTDEKQPCLFLYLHGGGGRNETSNRHVQHAALLALDTYLNEHHLNSVVIAPICPKGKSWERISTQLYALIHSVCEKMNIDRSRIYLMGTSFGAQGGWGLLSERTDIFAAAQLASAAPKHYDIEKVVKTPIYFTLGENDMDKPSMYESVIEKFREKGAEITFKILPNMNHREACNAAYTPESIEFLLSHIKQETTE